MRVLMLAWEYPPKVVGGLAMHVFDLSSTMAKNGADVTVITCSAPGAPESEIMNGVRVERVHPYDLPSRDVVGWATQLNVAMLEKAVQISNTEGSFDVIHAHDWLAAYAARALKHAFRVPLVVTIHATEYGRNNGLHNDVQHNISNIEWWLSFEAWKVICCSDYMVDEVRRVFSLPADKLVMIPNGVHPQRIRNRRLPENFRGRFALPWEKIICYVGRLVPEKGVQVLLDSACSVLRQAPDAKFVIAGTGPHEGYLRQKARDLGLGDKVYFTGYLPDDERDMLYLVADMAVVPSLYEPFGIVALEGMAAGIPVIVSDSGGLAETVQHNVDGLHAATGSAESLAAQILRVLEDPVLGDSLAENAYLKVNRAYDWRVIAAQTTAVYQSVVRESGRQGWRRSARSGMKVSLFGPRSASRGRSEVNR